MDVARWYEVNDQFYTIARLWAQESLFNDAPTFKGRQETLERLKVLRQDVDEVISELSSELEEEAWLQC